jgi:hypothetical protein
VQDRGCARLLATGREPPRSVAPLEPPRPCPFVPQLSTRPSTQPPPALGATLCPLRVLLSSWSLLNVTDSRPQPGHFASISRGLADVTRMELSP